jgi:hypothetical protein
MPSRFTNHEPMKPTAMITASVLRNPMDAPTRMITYNSAIGTTTKSTSRITRQP